MFASTFCVFHPPWCPCQHFIPSFREVPSHSMDIPVCYHPLKKTRVVSSFLAILNRCTLLCRFLYNQKSSFLWNKCSRVQLLGCTVVACLVLEDTAKLFQRLSHYIHRQCMRAIQFLCILTSIGCCH